LRPDYQEITRDLMVSDDHARNETRLRAIRQAYDTDDLFFVHCDFVQGPIPLSTAKLSKAASSDCEMAFQQSLYWLRWSIEAASFSFAR
jgi:hypothetical protein